MHRLAGVVIVLLLLCTSASAQTVFRFHVKLTDARTALLANPKVDELRLTEEQLQRAANDRVLLLDQTSGVSWNWLMLSRLESKPDVEHRINAKGVASPGNTADFGLTPLDERTLKVRCLRDQCALATTVDGKEQTFRLAKGQSRNVPMDSALQISFDH